MSTHVHADQPAYPMPIAVNSTGDVVSTGENLHPDWLGLTKREAFAMAAMQGILANPTGEPKETDGPLELFPQAIAVMATRFADALLAELAKATQP